MEDLYRSRREEKLFSLRLIFSLLADPSTMCLSCFDHSLANLIAREENGEG